jgi:hypothetical protein
MRGDGLAVEVVRAAAVPRPIRCRPVMTVFISGRAFSKCVPPDPYPVGTPLSIREVRLPAAVVTVARLAVIG